MNRGVVALVLLVAGCTATPGRVDLAPPDPPSPLVAYDHWEPSSETHSLVVSTTSSGMTKVLDEDGDGTVGWSPDGSLLAIDRHRSSCHDCTEVVLLDPDGRLVRVLTTGPGSYGFEAWSPDGKQIAYSETLDQVHGPTRLFTTDLRTGRRRELKVPTQYDQPSLVAWSPDGRRIMLAGSDEGIFVIDADGTHPRHITPPDTYADKYQGDLRTRHGSTAVWADSRHIVLSRDTGSEHVPHVDLVVVDVDAPNPVRALGLSRLSPDGQAVSPDGTLVAFPGGTDDAAARAIFVVPVAGGTPRRISPWQHSGSWGVTWSSDGRSVAFLGDTRIPAAEPFTEQAVWLADVASGHARRLDVAYTGTAGYVPLLQPSGRR